MFLGPYQLEGEISRGGMGVVFRARSPRGELVALKLLQKESSPDRSARFERERRLLGTLGLGEGFVPLLDSGQAPQGAFIVMPLVDGGTLRDRLRHGALPVEDVLALGKRLARAAGCAHVLGIVHRDLKPENILFTREGAPLIADLGLAKHFLRDGPGASQTVTVSVDAAFLGTAGYMSPEQARGAKEAGAPADVFALGAILWECLAGQPAFLGENLIEVLARVEAGVRPPLQRLRPETPRWLVRVLDRALELDPARRFPDGAALARALEAGAAPRRGRRGLVLAVGVVAIGVASFVSLRSLRTNGKSFDSPSRSEGSLRTNGDLAREAVALAAKRDFAGAIRVMDRAIALAPESGGLRANRGGIHLEAGDLEKARADFDAALKLDPRLASSWSNRSELRRVTGDLAGARDDLDRAIALEPKNASLHLRRGQVSRRMGDLDGALAAADRALELDPESVPAWRFRASVRIDRLDPAGARADAANAVTRAPEDAEAWALRGAGALGLRDFAGAAEDSRRATELDPRLDMAWANLGLALAEQGEVGRGLEALARAIDLAPRKVEAWINRAIVRMNSGDLEGSIEDGLRATEIDPRSVLAWTNLGEARRRKGDGPGALEALSRAIALDPRFLVPRGARAEVLLGLGRLLEARADSDELLRLEPRATRGWAVRAEIRRLQGDLEGAIADASEALNQAPEFPWPWKIRGRARAARGERALAAKDLARALEVGPGDPEAPALRAELEALR